MDPLERISVGQNLGTSRNQWKPYGFLIIFRRVGVPFISRGTHFFGVWTVWTIPIPISDQRANAKYLICSYGRYQSSCFWAKALRRSIRSCWRLSKGQARQMGNEGWFFEGKIMTNHWILVVRHFIRPKCHQEMQIRRWFPDQTLGLHGITTEHGGFTRSQHSKKASLGQSRESTYKNSEEFVEYLNLSNLDLFESSVPQSISNPICCPHFLKVIPHFILLLQS